MKYWGVKMNSPRKKTKSKPLAEVLAHGIFKVLIGIQKSEQIYKNLTKLDRKTLRVDEQEKYIVSEMLASKVENEYIDSGGKLTPDEIKKMLKDEIEKITK